MIYRSQSPESYAREQLAQTRTNQEWVNMINLFWKRNVVTVKHSGGMEVIASMLGPWPNGFPPKNAQ